MNLYKDTDIFTIETIIDGELQKVSVKKKLNLFDKLNFVDDVISFVVDEEGLRYVWRDFAVELNTIRYYTDIKLPEAIEKQNEFLFNNSHVIKDIYSNEEFDNTFYDSIYRAIDQQINLECNKILKHSKFDDLADAGLGLLAKLNTIIEGVDVEKLNVVISKLAEMKNISTNDIVGAIVNLKTKTKRPYNKKDNKNGSVIPIEKGQMSYEDVMPKEEDDK